MRVRHADPELDGAACAAIYAPFVDGSGVSFEDVAPTAQEMTARIAATSARFPWLVAQEDGGEIAGYAYASQHRDRAGYRWAVDVAVYVDPAFHGRGAGRMLYETLLDLVRRQGFRSACAGIALPNEASVGLHRALGFEEVGTYRDIGWKAGAWRDVSWWQLQLPSSDDDADGPPPEPLAPQRR